MNKTLFMSIIFLQLFGLLVVVTVSEEYQPDVDIWKVKRDEVKLFEYLFQHKKIDPLHRPVERDNETLEVSLDLSMIQIVLFDEKTQIMKSNVWVTLNWDDYQFKWSPSEFGGLKAITVDPTTIWTPDIVLFNNADGKYVFDWLPDVVINHNGNITWIPPTIYKSTCRIDVEYFPFDQQYCDIKMGSWTYNKKELRLVNMNPNSRIVSTESLKPSGGWELMVSPSNVITRFSTKINAYLFQDEDELNEAGHKSLIVHTIILRRNPLFYIVNLLIPCVMIGFLSVLVFYLRPEAGEKVTLSISIFLALVVFMLLVSKILPASSAKIPLISKYLLFTLVMNFLAIILTVVTINLNNRGLKSHGELNYWIKKLFFLNKQRNSQTENLMNDSMEFVNFRQFPEKTMSDSSSEYLSMTPDPQGSLVIENYLRRKSNGLISQRGTEEEEINVILRSIKRSMKSVEFIANHIRGNKEEDDVSKQWQDFATILERFLLLVFFIASILGIYLLLFQNRRAYSELPASYDF